MLRTARIPIRDRDDLAPMIRPLRVVEVRALIELRYFQGEHVELIDGALVATAAPSDGRLLASARVASLLAHQLGPAWSVLHHTHLALGPHSLLRPDAVVVPAAGGARAGPGLVLEVADGTAQPIDAVVKAELYAEHGVPTYWRVDLAGQRVRCFERPVAGRYTAIEDCGSAAVLTAGGLPEVALPVGDILAAAG